MRGVEEMMELEELSKAVRVPIVGFLPAFSAATSAAANLSMRTCAPGSTNWMQKASSGSLLVTWTHL